MTDKGFSELAEMVNILAKKPWFKEEVRKMRERKKQRYQAQLNNTVDDDEAILLRRELEDLEEVKDGGS